MREITSAEPHWISIVRRRTLGPLGITHGSVEPCHIRVSGAAKDGASHPCVGRSERANRSRFWTESRNDECGEMNESQAADRLPSEPDRIQLREATPPRDAVHFRKQSPCKLRTIIASHLESFRFGGLRTTKNMPHCREEKTCSVRVERLFSERALFRNGAHRGVGADPPPRIAILGVTRLWWSKTRRSCEHSIKRRLSSSGREPGLARKWAPRRL
jgi:hypothetical protein